MENRHFRFPGSYSEWVVASDPRCLRLQCALSQVLGWITAVYRSPCSCWWKDMVRWAAKFLPRCHFSPTVCCLTWLWGAKETPRSTNGITILLRGKRKRMCRQICKDQSVCLCNIDNAKVILSVVPTCAIEGYIAGNTVFYRFQISIFYLCIWGDTHAINLN